MAPAPGWSTLAVVGAGGIADTDQPGGAGVLEAKPHDEGGEKRGPLPDVLMFLPAVSCQCPVRQK
jgi:hypothetical protein